MRKSNSPMSLWDYCVERQARINNLTAKDNFKLHGTMPHTATLAEEGDISSLCQLDGMSGVTIVNKWLLFPTIVKYLDESWALTKVKTMRWPNGVSRPMGRLCPDNHYDHQILLKGIAWWKTRNMMCSMH